MAVMRDSKLRGRWGRGTVNRLDEVCGGVYCSKVGEEELDARSGGAKGCCKGNFLLWSWVLRLERHYYFPIWFIIRCTFFLFF